MPQLIASNLKLHRLSLLALLLLTMFSPCIAEERNWLKWTEVPPLPNEQDFASVHNNALIIAGGANFPQPIWENNK
ncbi:hypothetical protein [Blastopirellula marina]|uniref:hypothetical protein n=1 Tax=Blastopirellula marina TaxID=124 RepID=UPI00058EDFB8|nr:hypothetical protein [Blastopirellula marina]